MRIACLFVPLFFSTALLAQTGGDIRLGPPATIPDIGLGEIPQAPRPDKALNQPTNDALDKIIDRISFRGTPLVQALDQFAKDAHIILSVNWKELESAGIARNTPVTIELVQIPARRVLALIIASVNVSANAHFIVDDNRVVVSTREDLQSAKYQLVKVYDLRALFADWELDSPQAAEAADGLIGTIQASIDTDSWRDNGGTVGSARVLNGQLIINQTLENQVKIADLLHELTANPARPTRAYDVHDLVKDETPPVSPVPAPGAPPVLPPRVQSLIYAIQANCGRDTWRDTGGKTSSIAYFDGKLYITTRPAIHDQIERLLALMHK